MVGHEDVEARYAAFLSYSHKDAAAARWLHRRLESYRIPRRLVGRPGDRGPVPARLTPIFRDRDELPAAGDLSAKVRAALAASEALVVICSPDAAASPWVGREIAAFRELHPDRPILAAVVAGDPAQCFPAALTADGAEPLAADLRPEGDGRRLGLLKLVAGLAGTGLDSLVQRDAQRRLRRVTFVTLGALLAMLAMAVLTILALDARAEADRQRREAEGMVEFMLTDLRDRLKAVGRIDILSAANERALGYYQGQDLAGLSAESLERRARILHAMGEDDEKRSDRAAALAKFTEAHRVTAEQFAREPHHPQRIFAHAQSEYWMGYLAYIEKDWDRAARHWRAYKMLGDRLADMDRSNPDWVREAGYAEGSLCTLELARSGPVEEILRSCKAALAHMERVRALLPGDRRAIRDVVNRHAWMADAAKAAGDPGLALAHRNAQEHLLQPLAARSPDDADLQDQWMRTLMAKAETLQSLQRRRAALDYFRRARAIADRLTALDPANDKWRQWSRRIERNMTKGEEG